MGHKSVPRYLLGHSAMKWFLKFNILKIYVTDINRKENKFSCTINSKQILIYKTNAHERKFNLFIILFYR